ncbi:MAG: hypothetical protein Q8M94_09715 [Ignavibacteria bacterium]|nr:hypothetical protein [Ignavibacteria bacterium]
MKNKIGENIYRAKTSFKAESKAKITTDLSGLKEIKACRNLLIEKLFFVCSYCGKSFDKKKGFYTHINMAHPEHSHKYKEEW